MKTVKKKVAKKKAPARKSVPAVVETDSQRMISVIEKAAMNPEVDPEKMRQLLDVQLTIMDRQAKIEFDQAMAECQSQMADLHIVKNAVNDYTESGYAKHEQICKAIKPVYTKHGFRMSFSEDNAKIDHEIRIKCVVTHKAGHSEEFWIDLPEDPSGSKNAVQAHGSTLTYGRRYLTLMVYDLATYDDMDGNKIDQPEVSEELPAYTDAMLKDKQDGWKKAFAAGKSNPDHIIKMISMKYTLNNKQIETIKGLAA